jgi:hypothetical protein
VTENDKTFSPEALNSEISAVSFSKVAILGLLIFKTSPDGFI